MGRTGTLFAYEQSGVTPDIMTLAKGLGGGVPIGAMLASGADRRAASTPGSHGSTFGGNALTCAVGARGAARRCASEGVLANCRAHGRAPARRAASAARQRIAIIRDVRGRGLLVGAELREPGGAGRRALPRRGSAHQLHRRDASCASRRR